jgi:hypothetical protein
MKPLQKPELLTVYGAAKVLGITARALWQDLQEENKFEGFRIWKNIYRWRSDILQKKRHTMRKSLRL